MSIKTILVIATALLIGLLFFYIEQRNSKYQAEKRRAETAAQSCRAERQIHRGVNRCADPD